MDDELKNHPVLINCDNIIPLSTPDTRVNLCDPNKQANYEDLTVSIRNVYKSYETGKNVLSNMCMTVRKGTIYGLLGSSGCGKTTLLSCVVGLKKWNNGQILLFGRKPNGAPGKRVGFMPQETSLYNHLSVREMVGYYGRLYGMSTQEVEEKWEWLVSFLQLPAKFKLIQDLSGGQKRRVSLAITLVHSPELLILDEPTVGLDPLLRESIWRYLFKMVQTRMTTVIITTHYIEEAKYSNTIGVMRKGRLLVEDSPKLLLELHQCFSLEQVVLKLCHKDDEDQKRLNSRNVSILSGNRSHKRKGKVSFRNTYNVQEKMLQAHRSLSITSSKSIPEDEIRSNVFGRVKAMSIVMWLMLWRYPIFVVLVLLLPTMQLLLSLAVVGTQPANLKFGVINNDTAEFDACFTPNYYVLDERQYENEAPVTYNTSSCDFIQISCSLIAELSHGRTMTLVPLKSVDEARAQVKRGDLWGYFSFPYHYSQHLQDLVVANKFAVNETLEGSRLHLTMDMSNYLGTAFVIGDSYNSYNNFVKKMATNCGMNPNEFSLAIEYREPVFGKHSESYHDFMIPVIIITVVLEIAMVCTAILFVNDWKQGTLDRAMVAGLAFKEVMMSHFIVQLSLIIGQTVICTISVIFLYQFYVRGSYCLYFFICILSGLCGESLGLLLGVLFKSEAEALICSLFLGMILLMYAGICWPLAFFRPVFRAIGYSMPTTIMMESARSVISRGQGILDSRVWSGILVMTGWTAAFWIVSIVVFIRKQK